MVIATDTLRLLNPYDGIYAYYDGRIPGKRLYSEGPNWLDDGAYSLGVASYAIVSGSQALVYDTHISLAHARVIRDHIEGLGVTDIRVVLSHFHNDHIAGNEVFADCEIITLQKTADLMAANLSRIAARAPVIDPVVMPTTVFEHSLHLAVGSFAVELHHFDIHSADGNVLWLPRQGLLLAGDVVEDTVTYMAEPENLSTHAAELRRLRDWPINRILPAHGDPGILAGGGYDPVLIDANLGYIERMAGLDADGLRKAVPLSEFIAENIRDGSAIYFEPYEAVHAANVEAVAGLKA